MNFVRIGLAIISLHSDLNRMNSSVYSPNVSHVLATNAGGHLSLTSKSAQNRAIQDAVNGVANSNSQFILEGTICNHMNKNCFSQTRLLGNSFQETCSNGGSVFKPYWYSYYGHLTWHPQSGHHATGKLHWTGLRGKPQLLFKIDLGQSLTDVTQIQIDEGYTNAMCPIEKFCFWVVILDMSTAYGFSRMASQALQKVMELRPDHVMDVF